MNKSKNQIQNVFIINNVNIAKDYIFFHYKSKMMTHVSFKRRWSQQQSQMDFFYTSNNFVLSYHVLFYYTHFFISLLLEIYVSFFFKLLIKKRVFAIFPHLYCLLIIGPIVCSLLFWGENLSQGHLITIYRGCCQDLNLSWGFPLLLPQLAPLFPELFAFSFLFC